MSRSVHCESYPGAVQARVTHIKKGVFWIGYGTTGSYSAWPWDLDVLPSPQVASQYHLTTRFTQFDGGGRQRILAS